MNIVMLSIERKETITKNKGIIYMNKDITITLSEIPFSSMQGEGLYTGKNTIWVRLYNCNLQCDGFAQKDPTNPATYELPYKTIDISSITNVMDLPVFEQGCDSSYSWAKKYKHLISSYTPTELCDSIEELLSGTNGKFIHKQGDTFTSNRHLCFTGGEPLLRKNQKNIMSILDELIERDNVPDHITFETNGTQELTHEFLSYLLDFRYLHGYKTEFHCSISPKLFNVSGEKNEKAWKHDVISQYNEIFDLLSLKFVIDYKQASWDELDEFLSKLDFNTNKVYIMPVGATKESQEENIVAKICNKALDKGFHVSGRLHTYIYGNAIGT